MRAARLEGAETASSSGARTTQASVESIFNSGIQAFQPYPRVSRGETPMDIHLLLVAVIFPRRDVFSQGLLIGNAAIQTLALVVTSETRNCWDSRLATSMKAVEAIQEVKVLPRATASHQPGSETRWREETNVRNRVEQVGRVCIEPRKLFESRGPARDNHPRMPDPWAWEARTVAVRWNAVSACCDRRDKAEATGVRPDHADTGIARELVSASSAPPSRIRGNIGESTA